MIAKISVVTAAVALTALLAACSKEPPKCADERTAALVRGIILDQIGGSNGFTEKEIKENLRLDFPRATSFDEKIRKYICEARLVAGDAYQLPIGYESQLDDSNEHIVSVERIRYVDLAYIKIEIEEGVKKSRAAKK